MALHLKSTGIDFTDFSDATESSELLDDFEEGTFTPAHSAFSFGATPNGYYTKIGRLVVVQFYLEFSSSTVSDVTFTGLPFTAGSPTNANFGGSGSWNGIDPNSSTTLQPRINNASTGWTMYGSQPNASWDNTLTSVSGDHMAGMVVYIT